MALYVKQEIQLPLPPRTPQLARPLPRPQQPRPLQSRHRYSGNTDVHPNKSAAKKTKTPAGPTRKSRTKQKPCLSLALHPKRILQIKICEGVLNSYISYSNWRFFSEILIFLKFLKLINCKAETFNVFYDYSRIMNFSRILWIYAYLHSCKIAWIFGRLWTQKSRIFIRDIYYLCFTKSSEGCNTSFWKSSG